MCQDGRHVALSDTELAVQHHQVCELAHDGVVAVVLVCVAGQGQSRQTELVTDRGSSDGSGRPGELLRTKVCVCDQGIVEGVVVVLAQLLVAAGVGREGTRLRRLGRDGAGLDAVLEHLGCILLCFLVFCEQLRSVSLKPFDALLPSAIDTPPAPVCPSPSPVLNLLGSSQSLLPPH
jgi:hypothetical protein